VPLPSPPVLSGSPTCRPTCTTCTCTTLHHLHLNHTHTHAHAHTRAHRFPYVPSHLHHMVFELVKNSLRAVQVRGRGRERERYHAQPRPAAPARVSLGRAAAAAPLVFLCARPLGARELNRSLEVLSLPLLLRLHLCLCPPHGCNKPPSSVARGRLGCTAVAAAAAAVPLSLSTTRLPARRPHSPPRLHSSPGAQERYEAADDDAAEPPPIRLVVAEGGEDVTIKVGRRGGRDRDRQAGRQAGRERERERDGQGMEWLVCVAGCRRFGWWSQRAGKM
jgi:hypothetical protein